MSKYVICLQNFNIVALVNINKSTLIPNNSTPDFSVSEINLYWDSF
jgi:hypothetical protein